MVEMSAALKKFHASERGMETLSSEKIIVSDYDLECEGFACTLQLTQTAYVTSSRLWAYLGLADKLWQRRTRYRIFKEDGGQISGDRSHVPILGNTEYSPPIKVTKQNLSGMSYLAAFSNTLLDMERAGETSDQLSVLREFIDDLP